MTATVYDLAPEECAALGQNGPGKFWVVIERMDTEYESQLPDQVFGPYPSEEAATKAMEDSLLIEDACASTDNPWIVDECYVNPSHAEDADVILVDLTDPHHTGEPVPDSPGAGPIGIFNRGTYATTPAFPD